ncbi:glycosyltransferase family 2 protein [Treponema pedis]|uniref:glycosyltransferase family 2 protein n=1 Tax=Treponema pedis TaxID=409322 RepID=UPI0004139489|nr:glycosyltransferase family 2 protein [Treponema pedis]
MHKCLLSLCIPTNGIVEWIIPVLDSIFSQTDIDERTFEVIVSDNGSSDDLQLAIQYYLSNYSNISYERTRDIGFSNQISCLKRGRGCLIKFVNHRTKMLPGSIKYLIDYAYMHKDERPITYFLTGANRNIKGKKSCLNFDEFVRYIGIWGSWSTGLAIWKEDMNNLPEDLNYNAFFPHTTLLFYFRKDRTYIIDNLKIMDEIPASHAKKGEYNLFYAFAVEYPCIICDLLRSESISIATFLYVKRKIIKFQELLYMQFILCKDCCSYDLMNYNYYLMAFNSSCGYVVLRIKAFFHMIRRLLSGIKILSLRKNNYD